MEIKDFKYEAYGAEKKPAVTFNKLEDVVDELGELINLLEKNIGSKSKTSVKELFDDFDDELFFVGNSSTETGLSIPSVGINFYIPDSELNGVIYLGLRDDYESIFLPSLTGGPGNFDKAIKIPKKAHNVSIVFNKEYHVKLKKHSSGWDFSTSRSKYGVLYGDIAAMGGGGYNFINFMSTKLLQEYKEKKHMDIPMPSGLVFHWLNGGDNFPFNGIKFNSYLSNWGDGEVKQLIKHLGLGEDKNVNYTYERFNK